MDSEPTLTGSAGTACYADDYEPITREWLLSLGFVEVESDLGPTYREHCERNRVNVWEFNDTGAWLWNALDSVEMRTRKKLRDLLRWLDDDGPLSA